MELTPVMNEKSNRAARFAILQCLLRATGSCSMTEIYVLLYTRLFIS